MRTIRRERKGVTLMEAAMVLSLMSFMLGVVLMIFSSQREEQLLAEQEAVAQLDRLTARQVVVPVVRTWNSGGSIW